MKDTNSDDDYEQMSVGSGDAPNPNISKLKKKFKTPINKRKFSFIILLIIVIILGIYFLLKSSYASSLVDQNNDIQNEINLLSQKEEKLRKKNDELNNKKESLKKENDNIIQQINQMKEKNEGIKDNNNEMLRGISDKQGIGNYYESEINNNRKLFGTLRLKLRDIFGLLDYLRCGYFTNSDLIVYLRNRGLFTTNKQVDLLFIRLDKYRNGKIDFRNVEDELQTVY